MRDKPFQSSRGRDNAGELSISSDIWLMLVLHSKEIDKLPLKRLSCGRENAVGTAAIRRNLYLSDISSVAASLNLRTVQVLLRCVQSVQLPLPESLALKGFRRDYGDIGTLSRGHVEFTGPTRGEDSCNPA